MEAVFVNIEMNHEWGVNFLQNNPTLYWFGKA